MKLSLKQLILLTVICFTPVTGFSFDIPTLSGRVNDYGNLIPDEAEANLEKKLAELEKESTAQVVILTVSDLQGVDIDSFGIETARKWALGHKDKDNGLLITYAAAEDKYRIDVGFDLEGAIPDSVAGDIIRNNLREHANPRVQTFDFASGFLSAVQEIDKIIMTELESDPTGKSLVGSEENIGLWMIVIIGFILSAFLGTIHLLLGGASGAVTGILATLTVTSTTFPLIAGAIIGFIIGCLATFIMQAFVEGGGGGFSIGSSSGSSSGGFSGGGGDFGGGGASD